MARLGQLFNRSTDKVSRQRCGTADCSRMDVEWIWKFALAFREKSFCRSSASFVSSLWSFHKQFTRWILATPRVCVHSHVQILILLCCVQCVQGCPNWFKWASCPAAQYYRRCGIAFCDTISQQANLANPLWPQSVYTVAMLTLELLPATLNHSWS